MRTEGSEITMLSPTPRSDQLSAEVVQYHELPDRIEDELEQRGCKPLAN